ncbi:MAG: efflux RND transporter periplasmic adaptor subunit [Pseudomonadota bacterium]
MKSAIYRLVTLVSLATLMAACSSEGNGNAAESVTILRVSVNELARSEQISVQSRFFGRVEAPRSSQLGFELGGELQKVLVDEGQSVKAGELLARLDTDRLEAVKAQADAGVTQAKASAALAANTLKRSESAAEFSGISNQQLDQARQNAANSDAALAAALANLERIKLDIKKSSLRAPYAARIVGRYADEGEILAPGRALLALQELGPSEVRFGVNQATAERLTPGQLRTLKRGDQSIRATLKAIVPALDPRTRTIDAVFTLNEASVLSGEIMQLDVEAPLMQSGFSLPLSALTEGKRGLWTVLIAVPIDKSTDKIANATHVLSPRAVTILHQDGDMMYVDGAIETGELFVSEGLQRVVSGQQVRLSRATSEPDE